MFKIILYLHLANLVSNSYLVGTHFVYVWVVFSCKTCEGHVGGYVGACLGYVGALLGQCRGDVRALSGLSYGHVTGYVNRHSTSNVFDLVT